MPREIDALIDFFADPNKLAHGASARDKYGHRIDPKDRKAVQWCLYGAMKKLNTSIQTDALISRTAVFCSIRVVLKSMTNLGMMA